MLFRILALTTLLLAAGAAHAQSCGDTITRDVTLTADLHCTSGWEALTVAAPGVTIDLNGHTLSGSRGLRGIGVLDAGSVRIVNGAIAGFWGGVVGLRAHGIVVQGVTFKDLDLGIGLNYTQGARIVDNDFLQIAGYALSLTLPGTGGYGAAGFHHVGYNRFRDVGSGVYLCGYENRASTIVGNEFKTVADYGLHFSDGSGGHDVVGNRFAGIVNAGIVLRGSRDNSIRDNVFEDGLFGLTLVPEFSGRCATGPLSTPLVRDNFIEGNVLYRFETGIVLGLGLTPKPRVVKNWINGNRFADHAAGIYFQTDAHGNNATGNGYDGTVTPVVDEGRYNRY